MKDVRVPLVVLILLTWTCSVSVIMFNKYLLTVAGFPFPVLLTTWHQVFATLGTQVLGRTTSLLDSRHDLNMTPRMFVRQVMPVGIMFSASLIFTNKAFIYLSVSFIQMLKASMPVLVLLVSVVLRLQPLTTSSFVKVLIIAMGVALASYGEARFNLIGFLLQSAGILCESLRLVIMQMLLSESGSNIDPLVSLYYFAPICALFNAVVCFWLEFQTISMAQIYQVGIPLLLANGLASFALNVSVVFVVNRTSSLTLCLAGIAKDILIVSASMVMFGSRVTLTQTIGYSVAVVSMLWYNGMPLWARLMADRQNTFWSKRTSKDEKLPV